MQNFFISFNVVFPIFLMMALGFILKRVGVLSENTVKQMNNVIFRVFLPVMIFKNVYNSEIKEVLNPKLIVFSVVMTVLIVVLLFIIIPLIEKDNTKRGVLIQSVFRSNFVIFGLPITQALCGTSVLGEASVLVAIIVPIYNFMAVITLEIFNNRKPDFIKIIKGIIKNPLIIGSVLGILVNLIGVKFPTTIETSMGYLATITTPLALIILGASINLNTIGKNKWRIIGGVASRLLIVPAAALSLAAFVFGFRGQELAILIALFASPAAVSSFTMAQQMGADGELAGQLVMLGTVFCVPSVFMWIYVMVELGFI